MTPLEPGLEFLPGLVLVRSLGRGGMGEVWVARDRGRDEEVVAKVLPAGAPEDRLALLRREARLVRKLDHPSIVPVYGFEQGPNGCAVLLRHMKGGDATRLRGAAPLEIVRRGFEVAQALLYLHGKGVMHRDVKPSNVLLDEEGRAHLADFGIAAVAAAEDDEGISLMGGGSRGSMSPQQQSGAAPEPADDVYALGALLRDLLAGPPASPAGVTERPPLPTPHRSGGPPVVPSRLRDLVASMLASHPSERPAMEEVVSSLGEIETALGETAPPGRGPAVRLQPPPRVPHVAVLPSLTASVRGVTVERSPRSFSLPQAALLGSLAVAALFVVLVLPQWARHPSTLAPSTAPPVATGDPAPDAAPPAPASALPAEAPPLPAEATRTPRPAAPPVPRVDRSGSIDGNASRSVATREDRRVHEEFEAAMSEASVALDGRDFAAARRALERAAGLQPGQTVVADELRRVEEVERAASLARHRETARVLEAKEDWRGAVAEYEAALQLDPTVAFALDGRRRASRRARLAERLEFHARNEHRLTTEAVALEAEGVLMEGREVDSPGPRHVQQLQALERALARSRALVTVVLQSDGVTQVVVHKVGTLGAFKQKSLELRPGTYVVVGTRRGYRDVRQTLVVDPDAPPAPLLVRCEEAI